MKAPCGHRQCLGSLTKEILRNLVGLVGLVLVTVIIVVIAWAAVAGRELWWALGAIAAGLVWSFVLPQGIRALIDFSPQYYCRELECQSPGFFVVTKDEDGNTTGVEYLRGG